MKTKFLILILFSGLFSCDFICPPEKDKTEDKTSSDSTDVNVIQINDSRSKILIIRPKEMTLPAL